MPFTTREIESPDPVTRVAAADAALREPGQDDIGEKMVLNMGPSHPATHGVLRIVAEKPEAAHTSRRNAFPGIVTKVTKDKVSATVEIQAGPHRVVSLITREAADELGLKAGMEAVATVKATSVMVEVS